MLNKLKRFITFMLIFAIIFTTISFENVVYADVMPDITRVELEASNEDGNEITRYNIRGVNFEDPQISIDGFPNFPGMYTIENGAYVIEKNDSNKNWDIWLIPVGGKNIEIKVINSDTDANPTNNTHAVDYKIEKLPHINSVSAKKVYVGNELQIFGTGFDITEIDAIYIAGTPYTYGYQQGKTVAGETLQEIRDKIDDVGAKVDLDPTDTINADEYDFIITTAGDIYIPFVKDPHQSGDTDVSVVKDTGDHDILDDRSVEGSVVGRYVNAVSVVKQIDIIDPSNIRIVPNTGPVEGGTEVKIYDETVGISGLKPDMKIYIVEQGTNEIIGANILTDIEIIQDDGGDTIGIQGVTPPSPSGKQGVYDIIITDSTGNNEQVLSDAFTYEQKENLLSISKVEPPAAKATETVQVRGANIVNLNIDGLADADLIGYQDSVGDDAADEIADPLNADKLPKYENGKYILNYTANLNGTPVLIEREITVIIGKISEITGINLKTPSVDVIEVVIPETNDYGLVTVTLNTTTTITDKDTSLEIDVREEEADLVDGFTIISSITIPDINEIEPTKGDINEKIYFTIKGDNFQVLVDSGQNPILPVVTIGTKTAENVKIYDNDNNEINGIGWEIGTIIKGEIPANPGSTVPGLGDVKVINPDNGEAISYALFEYKNPSRDPADKPKITKIDPNIGPLDGGNTITIEGENFNYQEPTPEVIVTIDGREAQVVSATSSTIEVVVPPGFSIGEKPVQVITEDGEVATLATDDPLLEAYTYVAVLANPEVERIAPDFGGKDTVVYIFGRDKGEDFPNFFAPLVDPSARIEEMMGTRVLLNDIDVNDIGVVDDDADPNDYNDDDDDGSIYKREAKNPDGSLGNLKHINGNVYDLDTSNKSKSRVEYIDRNTLRVTIPDGYTAGLKDVTVLNPDSSYVTLTNGFDYKIPPSNANVQITQITPNFGSNTGGDFVTIKGNDFKDGIKVYFGGYESNTVQVVSNTELVVKTPEYPLPNPDLESEKTVEVVVVNYDGSSALSQTGYTFMAPMTNPEIDSIEPSSGNTQGNELVTINGKDFRQVGTELPTVFIGGEVAQVVEYNHDKLMVLTPYYGKEELVDVTVKNPSAEFGIVTEIDAFQYQTSKPNITSVFPDRGQKVGGDEITIRGEGIIAADFTSEIQVLPSTSEYEPKIDVLAIFDDEKDETSLLFGEARNTILDIEVDYNNDRTSAPVQIDDSGTTTTDSLVIYYEEKVIGHYPLQPEESRIFVVDWAAFEEEKGEEAIMVELIDNTLITTRRIAPSAEVVNKDDDEPEKVVVTQIPPVAFIGDKDLYVRNKDNGEDSIGFEYVNASSRPEIIEITPRTEVLNTFGEVTEYLVESTIDGNMYITIEGYDFREGVEVFVDGDLASLVSFNILDEQNEEGRYKARIVVKSPLGDQSEINEKKKIVIINPDGGFVDSSLLEIPYYFIYRIPESEPYIESVTPEATSQAGGNTIRLTGYDFSTGAKVIVGGLECSVISVSNYEIVFTTPTDLTMGLKDVQVINTDYGMGTKTAGIEVISYPIIKSITDEGGEPIQRVSIEGGEKILILGSNFQGSSTVYFGGEREEISASTLAENKGLFKDDKYFEIADAYKANEVEFVSESKLLVTVPEVLNSGEYGITILNGDGGLSDNASIVDFDVPIPKDPVGLKAEIVNDKYIRIYGYTSENVDYYEVYTYLGDDDPDDEDFKYLDTTTRTSYKITEFEEIDDDEDIYLRIKAVNKYGPSEWSNTVKIRNSKLDDLDGGIGGEDEDGDIFSEYQEDIGKDSVNVVLGTDRLRGNEYEIYFIDLKDKKYDGIDTRMVNIPGKLVKESNRTMLVDNGDTRLQFTPKNFYIYSYLGMSKSEQKEVYARLTFQKTKGPDSDYLARKVSRKHKLKSKIYQISAEFILGRDKIRIDSTAGAMDLEISYDENSLMGIDESKLRLYKFDPTEGEWSPVAGGIDKQNNKVFGRIDGPGHYAILGEK